MSRWLVVGLIVAVAAAACAYPRDTIKVFNASSQSVHLAEEFRGNRLSRGVLEPGTGYITPEECLGDLVVTSMAGKELVRRPGPFCQGDPEWVITDEMLPGDA